MKTSQKEWVVNRLLEKGSISRNECLRRVPAITRLSAITHALQQQGWLLSGFNDNGDYRYNLVKKPAYLEDI